MTEAEFHQQLDDILDRLEEAVEAAADAADDDVDCDQSGGVLTMTFGDGSCMNLSRQAATRQLWLAARAGGFHFQYSSATDDWRCTRSGIEIKQLVRESMASQAGFDLPVDW